MTPTADLMKLVETVGRVLEGWTLPDDARKQMEAAYYPARAALSAMGEARVGGEDCIESPQHCPVCKFTMSGIGYCVNCLATPAQPKASEHPMDEVGRMMFGDHPKASEGEAGVNYIAAQQAAFTYGLAYNPFCSALRDYLAATLTAPGADDGQ